MGAISEQIKKQFAVLKKRKVLSIDEIKKVTAESGEILDSFKLPDRLKDYDPLHAIHISTQNLVAIFAEQVVHLPEMKEYKRIFKKTFDSYMPAYPPISPITNSFFSMWSSYYLTFGKDHESIGSIMVDMADVLGIPDQWLTMITTQMKSRMGIYEHCGVSGDKIILKELVSEDEYLCYCSTGYVGSKGEIWLACIMESPFGLLNYHVVFTTPYILRHHTKEQWIEYFQRNGIDKKDALFKDKLDSLMRYGTGKDKNQSRLYWLEYIMDGYDGYRSDVIFLRGIPDLPKTLPHGGMDDE